MPPVVINVDNPRLGQDIFEARLTETLLARSLVSSEGLQESLRQQVLLGGHLATNLWELHLVEGKELTQISAELLGVPIADPKDVSSAPAEVRRLFTRDFIEQLRVLPIRIIGSVLQVATAEPWDLLTLGRAAYHCGYPVEPFFLAEVPLAALMEKIHGIPTTARFWFGVQTNERRAQKLARGEAESEAEAAAHRSVLLTYVYAEVAKIRRGRKPRPEGMAKTPDEAAATPTATNAPGVESTNPSPTPEEFTPAVQAQSGLGMGIAPEAAISAATAAAEAVRAAPASVMAPVQRPGAAGERLIVPPLTGEQAAAIEAPPAAIASIEEANAILDLAAGRDEVGLALLRFALSKAQRVIVFVRRALLWAGWMGAGEGVDVAHLQTLLMPTAPGTIFGLVADTGAHYIGPLAPHPSYAPFLAALGGGRPRTAALLPVHFHGRLVFGLYLDGGAQKRVTADIGDLIVLAQRVPAALERLIQNRVRART